MSTTENPYDDIAEVPSFTVTSESVRDGEKLPAAQVSGIFGAGGQDVSPELTWSGFPESTRSFAVTVYDPDAPTAAGFWHWAVVDIPAEVHHLPAGAGDDAGSGLPDGALQLKNDGGLARYLGAAPPAGHGRHRYFIGVHALDVPSLELSPDASPALLGFTMSSHTLARGWITPWYEVA